jgi:ribosomal protein L32
MVTCLNCADWTDNHAICDKCFAAAERNDGSLAKRQRGTATFCPECGYTEADAVLHGDHWRCSGTITPKKEPTP